MTCLPGSCVHTDDSSHCVPAGSTNHVQPQRPSMSVKTPEAQSEDLQPARSPKSVTSFRQAATSQVCCKVILWCCHCSSRMCRSDSTRTIRICDVQGHVCIRGKPCCPLTPPPSGPTGTCLLYHSDFRVAQPSQLLSTISSNNCTSIPSSLAKNAVTVTRQHMAEHTCCLHAKRRMRA